MGEALKGDAPYIQTILSPLTVAARLAGAMPQTPTESVPVKQFMKENPEAVHQGLSTIAQTVADYTRECIRAGADGIFYTTTVWSLDTITEEEYKAFGVPYDRAVLEAAVEEGATFNVLHLCRENLMLDLLSSYPVQALSYDVHLPRNPSLKEVMGRTDKALWGGVDHKATLMNGPVEAIAAEVNSALQQTGGQRFIFGPGCAAPAPVPEAHYMAVKQALSTWCGG